jgi:hypothetical protein
MIVSLQVNLYNVSNGDLQGKNPQILLLMERYMRVLLKNGV